MGLADQIREHAFENFIEPRIAAGDTNVTVRAGDVHDSMNLVERLPAVCSALETQKFLSDNNLRIKERRGPKQGTTTTFVYELGGSIDLVAAERRRRLMLWGEIEADASAGIKPKQLTDLRIYGGAQGIWVDKKQTARVSTEGHGVTVGLLHAGQHYPDDLSDDGMIYHFPDTDRPPGRDQAEVNATKEAMRLRMPIFAILPGKPTTRRFVKLAWVTDVDDRSQQFLVTFHEIDPEDLRREIEEPEFSLMEPNMQDKFQRTKRRGGQQKFRFDVLRNYGCKCAVCDITHLALVKAAHIRGKQFQGSDHWRNGLPLCSTHYDAYDAHLFSIDPESLRISFKPGLHAEDIGIACNQLATEINRPHPDALKWRAEKTSRAWRGG